VWPLVFFYSRAEKAFNRYSPLIIHCIFFFKWKIYFNFFPFCLLMITLFTFLGIFGWTQRFFLWILVIFSFLKWERTVTVPWSGNVILQTTLYFLQFERFRSSNVPGCSPFLNVPRRLKFLTVYKFFYP
jgi:hypothetical protein